MHSGITFGAGISIGSHDHDIVSMVPYQNIVTIDAER